MHNQWTVINIVTFWVEVLVCGTMVLASVGCSMSLFEMSLPVQTLVGLTSSVFYLISYALSDTFAPGVAERALHGTNVALVIGPVSNKVLFKYMH